MKISLNESLNSVIYMYLLITGVYTPVYNKYNKNHHHYNNHNINKLIKMIIILIYFNLALCCILSVTLRLICRLSCLGNKTYEFRLLGSLSQGI